MAPSSAPAPSAEPAPSASSSVEIAAPAEVVWAIISDPARLAEVAEETVRILHRRAAAGRVGSRWVGINRHGWRVWPTMTRVVEAVPARRLTFDVGAAGIPVARWRYDLEPLPDGGVRVTESTWDRRPGWFAPVAAALTGSPDRAAVNQRNIERTLARLEAAAAAHPHPHM